MTNSICNCGASSLLWPASVSRVCLCALCLMNHQFVSSFIGIKTQKVALDNKEGEPSPPLELMDFSAVSLENPPTQGEAVEKASQK